MSEAENTTVVSNFIRQIINEDLESGKNGDRVVTRFPPEPNGYLHIGHAKSICLNFGLARDYKGVCHLRMDDTNPAKEEVEYMESIIEDVKWLGFDWKDKMFYASDYYDKLYEYALELIKMGKAFVCELDAEEMRKHRGSLKEPGKESPYRNRTVEENLALFEKMRAGEVDEGKMTLRAKIDMASPNVNMRDPVIYRVKKVTHERTGDKWCIYPMYDYAHPISDMMEGITHSICTLEFEDHRPLYDWCLDTLKTPCHPQQIEFARLNLYYTVMSKRKLLELVEKKYVDGWNDPRMPTISGIRRRGYPAAAVRNFCDRIGVGKKESWIDVGMLEECVREELNMTAPRVMGVIDPIKVVITNYSEGEKEILNCPYHPQDESFGDRPVPFGRELYIEREDFMEEPPKGYFRLRPGGEVRLRYAYYIKCEEVIKNDQGEIVELRCTYDPESKGGKSPDGRKVKGTIHWVYAPEAYQAEVRLYDRLFNVPLPDSSKDQDYKENLNPNSLKTLKNVMLEPSLRDAKAATAFQFERQGYFFVDSIDSKEKHPVFNRIVTLRDTWQKVQA